jgi:ATP-dependent protease ClpP protease subunit
MKTLITPQQTKLLLKGGIVKKQKKQVDNDEEIDPIDMFAKLNDDDSVFKIGNDIYFRDDVSKESVTKLIKLLETSAEEYSLTSMVCKNANITPKPIYLHISTYGGCLYNSLLAYDKIRSSIIPVYTVVEGYAFSGGTIMSMAGKKRYMTESSYFLIHQLRSGCDGKFNELEDSFQNDSVLMKKLTDLYTNNSKMKRKDVITALKHDLVWDTETCIRNGLIDEVYDINTK